MSVIYCMNGAEHSVVVDVLVVPSAPPWLLMFIIDNWLSATRSDVWCVDVLMWTWIYCISTSLTIRPLIHLDNNHGITQANQLEVSVRREPSRWPCPQEDWRVGGWLQVARLMIYLRTRSQHTISGNVHVWSLKVRWSMLTFLEETLGIVWRKSQV